MLNTKIQVEIDLKSSQKIFPIIKMGNIGFLIHECNSSLIFKQSNTEKIQLKG